VVRPLDVLHVSSSYARVQELTDRFEWTCFALISSPIPIIPVPLLQTLRLSPRLAYWVAKVGFWPPVLIAPEWLFVVNEIAAMVPRAIRAQAWYRDTFGERFPKDRKIVIPGLF
jgi:3-oxo-5-alpha-steroid 4-dehydrogenase 1